MFPLQDFIPVAWLSVENLASPSQPTTLFFAVKPDLLAAAWIHRWVVEHRERCGLAGHPLPPDRLHITLMSMGAGTGTPSAGILNVAQAMGDTIRRAPFEVVLNHAGSFASANRRRPYVLLGEDGVLELRLLHRDLVGASLRFTDRERAFPRFTPHMTVLYDDQQLEWRPIRPISWTVRELLLIESWAGRTRHIVRGRWLMKSRSTVGNHAKRA